jgi:hypothetical protein
MKKAAGFVTDDGTFFEDEQEAKMHEAESRLIRKLSEVLPETAVEQFISLIMGSSGEIEEYINAANTVERNKAKEQDRGATEASGTPEVVGGAGHVSSTEEDLASLLKLPSRGHEHVPDVGDRSRSKKISDRRAKHGA